MKNKKNLYLVTGCAGFIGFNLCQELLKKGHYVDGIDNLNNYYNPKFKVLRLNELNKLKGFNFEKIDISKSKNFIKKKYDCIFHLAAEVGVRNSENNIEKYIDSNLIAFNNVLVNMKNKNLKKIIFASSSSVYNSSLNKIPFKENEVDYNPKSIYGITKLTKEKIAAHYSFKYKFNIIGLRFFTVYGIYGRPDMEILKFINQIYNNLKLVVHNQGLDQRDYTYIDDVVYYLLKSSTKLINKRGFFKIFNIGSGKPVNLNDLIYLLSNKLNKKVKVTYKNIYDENSITQSSNMKLFKNLGKRNFISLDEGLNRVVNWYLSFKDKKSMFY